MQAAHSPPCPALTCLEEEASSSTYKQTRTRTKTTSSMLLWSSRVQSEPTRYPFWLPFDVRTVLVVHNIFAIFILFIHFFSSLLFPLFLNLHKCNIWSFFFQHINIALCQITMKPFQCFRCITNEFY